MKPREIILEVTNFCNLRCRFCHIHGEGNSFSRQKGKIEKKLWEKVLQELASWNTNVNLISHGAGEPLLYKKLPELLTEAKKLKNLTVGFMTNGMLLDKNMVNFLIDNQIDWIALSIDGTNPDTHDAVRRGAKLEIIEKNLAYLIDQKQKMQTSKPLLKFNMVLYPHIKDQKKEYLKRWLPHAESVIFSKFRPLGDKFLWDEKEVGPKFRPCPHLYNQAVISWQGDMALCCEDIETSVSPGSIKNSTIEHIFTNSPIYHKYRNAHENNKIEGLTLCSKCHIWAAGIIKKDKIIKIEGMDIQYTKTYSGEIFKVLKGM